MDAFFNFVVSYLAPAGNLLIILAGLIYYKQINRPLRTLLVYLIAALLINIAGILLANKGINNLPLLHVYTIVELVSVMWYYRVAFGNEKVSKWIAIIMMAFPVFCVVNFSFFQSIYTFNTYTRPLEALIIIVVSGIYLSTQSEFKTAQLITTSGRIVASGFLIYFFSSLFQFIFSNVVSHMASREVKHLIWNLHATFVLIMYLFFFRAILNERDKR